MEPLSLQNVRTISLSDRPSKVRLEDMGVPWVAGGTLRRFLRSLPNQLAGAEFRAAVSRTAGAVSAGRTVLLGMGAHPIKVGLSPLVIDWMRSGGVEGAGVERSRRHSRRGVRPCGENIRRRGFGTSCRPVWNGPGDGRFYP